MTIMSTRKVSVFIYQYPKDANSCLSLRRLVSINEELLYHEKFISDRPLCELMQSYIGHTNEYASLCDEEHCFRIVVRDSESRLSISFRA